MIVDFIDLLQSSRRIGTKFIKVHIWVISYLGGINLNVYVEKKGSFHKLWPGTLMSETDWLWLCWTGSSVCGEWGSAHIWAAIPCSPGHAHEGRDDIARRVQPVLQAESRAHRARVGGVSSAKLWEKGRTRQWNQVSQDKTRPQGSTGSRIIWLRLCYDQCQRTGFFSRTKNVCLLFTYQM